MEATDLTYQPLQDPLALVIGAVVGQNPPVHQNQAVQEQPRPKPEQSKEQRPPPGPQPEPKPPENAESAPTASSA